MKQTSLFKQFFLLVLLLVGSATGAWADETQVTINFGSTEGYWAAHNDASYTDSDSRTWTRTFSAGERSSYGTNYSQFGNSSNTCTDLEFIATAGKDMTLTAFSVTMSGASGGNSPTVGIIYLYKKSGDTETQLATASVNGTDNVICSITSNQAFSSTDELEVKYVGTKKAIRISTLTYSYTTGGGSSVTAPKFSVASGAVTAGTTVSLTQATADEIRYTTDGTAPTTTTGTVYSTPIAITEPVTIKAIAVEGGVASSVATATYTISVTTPTIAGGANVTITGDEGCTFYYTTAVGDKVPDNPDNNSTEYTAPFTPADGTKIKAIAYDAYGNKSDVTSVFTFKYMPLNPKNINSNYYVKVTDASTLENGDAILIVCEEHNSAMSTTQNPNNRSDALVSIASGVIQSPSASVQKIVLVKQTEKISDVDTDVFYFYTGAEGYLYAASSSKNYLRTEVLPSENARATISISSGDATILFTGTNANKWLKHNYSGTSNLFSCYPTTNTTMDIVQIYKEVASVDVTDAKYATYVTACDVDFAASTGVTAYKVTGANGKIELEEVDAAPKGTPLVIAAEENTYVLNVAASTPAAVTGNLLKAADGNQTGDGTGNFYVLGKDNQGKVGFGPLANDVTLAVGKAYIDGTEVTAKGFLPFVIDEENETTSINSIENGESRIENSDYIYNLSGQRVGKDYKGIVVVNGKKVIRK